MKNICTETSFSTTLSKAGTNFSVLFKVLKELGVEKWRLLYTMHSYKNLEVLSYLRRIKLVLKHRSIMLQAHLSGKHRVDQIQGKRLARCCRRLHGTHFRWRRVWEYCQHLANCADWMRLMSKSSKETRLVEKKYDDSKYRMVLHMTCGKEIRLKYLRTSNIEWYYKWLGIT